MKSQATRYTQKQLAYLAYWQQRGYTFDRDSVIPESTQVPPNQWYITPRWFDLAGSVLLLALIVTALYLKS